MTVDPVPHFLACAEAVASNGPRAAVFAAADRGLKALIGHGLFTVLQVTKDGAVVERLYSSDEKHYPLAGRKTMGPTPWGDLVLKRGKPFVGSDAAAIRWAFPDRELIESLGLAATINTPVANDGRVLGTLNILDRAGSYTDGKSLAIAQIFASLVVPAFSASDR